MKKTLITLLALAFSIHASAQWHEPILHEADKLLGQKEYYSNLYDAKVGSLLIWSNENNVRIATYNGIFDYENEHVPVIIGLYVDGELKRKVRARFYVRSGSEHQATTDNWFRPGIGKLIINHLKYKGDIRIVAKRYGRVDLDMYIPMNPELIHK